ncbi:MAG: hypothetical protein SP1CHLAM54_06930 [Chlamydiia bacterium]|nr:hypothetical protein [Chlamydiia bacterium]MCH9615599.1 hypothetical protein [Chlamydiia bacterium]MCH9628998.1 hypothetical protein [Chlamydiia bacterium]
MTSALKRFIPFAILCGFCITLEYAICKPTSNSVFIDVYGVRALPFAWLLTIPLNLFIVTLYNRFIPKLGPLKLLIYSTSAVICLNTAAAFFLKTIPGFAFLHFVLKDIYVLLMFQQLWSVIHANVEMKKAKYLYGVFFGIGGLGSVLGSYITAHNAIRFGSEHLLLLTTPIFLVFMLLYYGMMRQSIDVKLQASREHKGLRLLFTSKPLQLILLIVVFMQMASTLLEYQFNMELARIAPMQDERTAYSARIFAYINMASVFLQLVGTYFFLRFLGLFRSHIIIPGYLLVNGLLSLTIPSFRMLTYSFGATKAFDHSVFRIITEMLYIPLGHDEKFKAKAIIDVFAYRTARAFASFLVIGLQLIRLEAAISYGCTIVLAAWLALVIYRFGRYDRAYEAI